MVCTFPNILFALLPRWVICMSNTFFSKCLFCNQHPYADVIRVWLRRIRRSLRLRHWVISPSFINYCVGWPHEPRLTTSAHSPIIVFFVQHSAPRMSTCEYVFQSSLGERWQVMHYDCAEHRSVINLWRQVLSDLIWKTSKGTSSSRLIMCWPEKAIFTG